MIGNPNLVFTSLYDPSDINQWSGTPYFLTRALASQAQVRLLQPKAPLGFTHRLLKKLKGSKTPKRFDPYLLKSYARTLERAVPTNTDFILSPQIQPFAFYEGKKPLVLYTDALFTNLLGFHPPSDRLDKDYVTLGVKATRATLERLALLFFSSDWAASFAIANFGIEKEKVKVIPFGANLPMTLEIDTVKNFIKKRSRKVIKLLFIGKQWEEKGGDIVLNVANALHQAGFPVELTVIGIDKARFNAKEYPFVRNLGFLVKNNPDHFASLQQVFAESHFFFMPSRIECYGIVYAEASAFGVPSIASYVGGVESVVRDGINGKTFSLYAPIDEYCNYIVQTFEQVNHYESLALSAFNEYQTRLNWPVATKILLNHCRERLFLS